MPNTLRYRNSDFYNVANLEASVVKTFTGSVATNTPLGIWTPATGKKFVLKGFAINAVVGVVLNGTATSLWLVDNTVSTLIFPLAAFSATQAANSVLRQPTVSILPYKSGGFVSAAANNALKVVGDATVGTTGTILVSGIVWGDEV